MAEPRRHVLLLADRLGSHLDGWPLRTIVGGLERAGFSAQALCVSNRDDAPPEGWIFECPGLGHRWQRLLAVRQLRFDEGLRRPDLIHVLHRSMAPLGLAIAERWEIPYVQTIEDFPDPDDRLRVSRRWCRRLLAVSREVADALIRDLGIPPRFLAVVNRGIALPEVCPPTEGPKPIPVIGMAGPLVPSSGFTTFLGAARRVLDAGIDAEFVVAGQGAGETELRRRADRLRVTDRVTFTNLPGTRFRFWSVLNLYCQTPSVPTVGRTLALAMASAVPSVASDVEGLRSLVAPDVTGLRVPPDDSIALAATLVELLRDPPRARALGLAAREFIRREFHPEGEIAQLTAVYRATLESPAVAVPPAVLV